MKRSDGICSANRSSAIWLNWCTSQKSKSRFHQRLA